MELKFVIFYSLILLEQKVHSALNIEECPTGMINVTEDDELSLTCGPYNSDVRWYYYDDNKFRYDIAYCSGLHCYPTQSNKFRTHTDWFSWNPRLYKNTLDITSVTRQEARSYHCTDFNSVDTCRLRVTVPAILVSKNCNVEISNWKVQGKCEVARMYSPDSIYKCTWSVNDAELPSGFEEPLTNWTDRYTSPFNRTYMRGNCSFKQDMPSIRYSYTYKISVDPGLQNFFVKTINIVPPEKPEINCSETVLEGSTVNCMCTSPNRGNPPAHFLWDGTNTDEILLRNVRRQKNSTKYTCRQTWGPYGLINTTVNYTLTVAYGPSDVSISIVILENGTKTLICTAIDVFPSATFHWNILCGQTTDTMTTSTCTLPARDTDGDIVVLCTASNTAFPDSSVEKNFIVNVPHTKTELSLSSTEESIRQADKQNTNAKDSSSSGSINGGLIGGVVAAVVLAIIIGAVIVVFIVKRRKETFNSERFTSRLWPRALKFFHKKSPLPTPYATVNKPTSTSPIKRLAAPSGDLYTRPTSTISVDYNGEYVTVSDNIENSVDGINKDFTLMTNQSKHETADLKESSKRTINQRPATANTNNFQDTTGSVYMNVTEVPTDSGLGVYHIVPWRTMSTQETDTRNDGAAAGVSEDEYNALNFEEDRSGQEDQAATYHHLEHE